MYTLLPIANETRDETHEGYFLIHWPSHGQPCRHTAKSQAKRR